MPLRLARARLRHRRLPDVRAGRLVQRARHVPRRRRVRVRCGLGARRLQCNAATAAAAALAAALAAAAAFAAAAALAAATRAG